MQSWIKYVVQISLETTVINGYLKIFSPVSGVQFPLGILIIHLNIGSSLLFTQIFTDKMKSIAMIKLTRCYTLYVDNLLAFKIALAISMT